MRLPDKRDVEAWDQFVAIYEPLVYRLARAKGFQDADAREIVQEVMVAVSQAVERWEPDSERGRFRDWLFCIARNFMINYLTRRKYRSFGGGGSSMDELLEQQPAPDTNESAEFDLEYRREIFRLAAEQVRDQVNADTWQAFWRTSVEDESVEAVAEQLGMTPGMVYTARSRVRARLRNEVQRFQQQD